MDTSDTFQPNRFYHNLPFLPTPIWGRIRLSAFAFSLWFFLYVFVTNVKWPMKNANWWNGNAVRAFQAVAGDGRNRRKRQVQGHGNATILNVEAVVHSVQFMREKKHRHGITVGQCGAGYQRCLFSASRLLAASRIRSRCRLCMPQKGHLYTVVIKDIGSRITRFPFATHVTHIAYRGTLAASSLYAFSSAL